MERVEPAVNERELLLVIPKSDNIVRGDGGHVEAALVDVDGIEVREHVKHPNGAGASRPAVAENGLVLAAEHAHVRAVRNDGEFGGCFVEGLF